jgi:predicted dehydrogenase
MQKNNNIRIAVVGLNFGASFAKIYRDHPDVEYVGICDLNEAKVAQVGNDLGISLRHTDVEEVIRSNDYDAIHLLTPIPSHARLSIDILNAGKHCACAVPMGTTLDELYAIVEASQRNGKNFMMMETAVYTYHYLMVKEMMERGEFGRIQLLKGYHYQDMENWPDYWEGLPPMHYATHAIGPLLAISNSRATKVHCLGSGVMRDELKQQYGNPFPIENALFQLDREHLSAEVTRSLFQMARSSLETFSVYGEKLSFEWLYEDMAFLHAKGELQGVRGTQFTRSPVTPVNYDHLLPEAIRGHEGHLGSHAHLAHEFIRSAFEKRNPFIDAVKSAQWTAAGICAHESAMQGGTAVEIPSFMGEKQESLT